MMVIVATLAQRFAPRTVPGHPIEVASRPDLHARYGMRMLLDRAGG
jgi:hypothetical protein